MSRDVFVPVSASPSPRELTPEEDIEAPLHEDYEPRQGLNEGPQTYTELQARLEANGDILGGAVAMIHAKSNGSIVAPDGIDCRIHFVDFLMGDEVFYTLFVKPEPYVHPKDEPLVLENHDCDEEAPVLVNGNGDYVEETRPLVNGNYGYDANPLFVKFRNCGIRVHVSGNLQPARDQGELANPSDSIYLMSRDFPQEHRRPTWGMLFIPMSWMDLTVPTHAEDTGIIGRVISLVHLPSGEVLGDGIIGWNRRL